MSDSKLAYQRWEEDYRSELVKKNYIIGLVAAILIPLTAFLDLEDTRPDTEMLFLMSRSIPALIIVLTLIVHKFAKFNATAIFYIVYLTVCTGSVIRTEDDTYTNYVFYHVAIFVVSGLLSNIKVLHTIIVGVIISIIHIVSFFAYYYPEIEVSSGGLLIFVGLNVMFVFANKIRFDITRKNFVISRELEEQNIQINKQKETLEGLYAELSEKNKSITDSINYAQRIQNAKLPTTHQISGAFPKHFILFKPRDIVSGDFYWHKTIGHDHFIAVADCTGHGVPGAFMSVIGDTLLTQIIEFERLQEPGEILSRLHLLLSNSLQTNVESKVDDGMDIALCIYNDKLKSVRYAGAKNPLLLCNGQVNLIKGDKFSIGGGFRNNERELKFTSHEFPVDDPTMLFLFSDGFQDQFGGTKSQKFSRKRFYALLEEIVDLPCEEQRAILDERFENWRGTTDDQIDDVLVMGIRIE